MKWFKNRLRGLEGTCCSWQRTLVQFPVLTHWNSSSGNLVPSSGFYRHQHTHTHTRVHIHERSTHTWGTHRGTLIHIWKDDLNEKLKTDSEGSSRTFLLEFERKTTGHESCNSKKLPVGGRLRWEKALPPFQLGCRVQCGGQQAVIWWGSVGETARKP